MQIEIEGQDAREFTEELLLIEGIQGSCEALDEVEKNVEILFIIAAVIDISLGTWEIAEKVYELKRKKFDSPEPAKIERVLLVGKNGDRLLLKDASIEQIKRLLDEEK
jgi:hypothetical protein